MKTPTLTGAPLIGAVLATCLLGGGLFWWFGTEAPDDESPQTESELALPKLVSRFDNAVSDEAQYVGSETCRQCHEEQYAGHQLSPHAHAMATIDVSQEPPDTVVHQKESGRSYRVFRRDETMIHQEFIVDGDEEVVLAEHPIHYVIGSGHHSRSYLISSGDFLLESPVTWYASRGGWDMSPGYESDSQQPGFSRTAKYECIRCHSGSVTAIGGSSDRLQVKELGIGCERCHGPGSLHTARWSTSPQEQSQQGVKEEFDPTIVHPARLSREEQEYVCAQCHLQSEQVVPVPQRGGDQFRPGLRLADFVTHFKQADKSGKMTVVGHIEQMHDSKCYTQSSTLTCLTCHDPHQRVENENLVSYYRDKCLACHNDSSCGLEKPVRLERDREDRCYHCHMPKGDTDLAHFAFTHHRIGLHGQDSEPSLLTEDTTDLPSLVPFYDDSHLPQAIRERAEGLAYLKFAISEKSHRRSDRAIGRAFPLLKSVIDGERKDSAVESALAQYYWRRKPPKTIEFGQAALTDEQMSSMTRTNSNYVVGTTFFDAGELERAKPYIESMVQLRRQAEDWMLLSIVRQRGRDMPGAIAAAHKAAEIEPDRPDLQNMLKELYTLAGDTKRAATYQERAELLTRIRKP
jgi:predicted CXXCH cytochrome family protein